MLCAVICTDKPDALEIRKATRREHLEHLNGLGDRLRLAGPFLTEDGAAPCGSLLIIEGESLAAVRAFADADPYARAGVFESVEVRPWTVVLGGIGK